MNLITFERRRGVRVMVWYYEGAWRSVSDLARAHRLPVKTVRTRFEVLRKRKALVDVTDADLGRCLRRERRAPGPAKKPKRAAPAKPPPPRITLDLLQLLALGAPVAKRAMYAQRLAGA